MTAKKWIGVDIHKKQFTVCVIDSSGKKHKKSYTRDSAGIKEFLKQIDSHTVVGVESTTWTWSFAKRIQDKAKDVIVFNTLDLKSLMSRIKKTDDEDAERMAVILRRFEKNELTICHIRSEKFAEIKGLLNMREELVSQKVRLKNKVTAALDYWGVEKPPKKLYGKAERDIKWIESQAIPENIKNTILRFYVSIVNLELEIKELSQTIEEICVEIKGYRKLREIKGIGNITAAYLISKIENIERFSGSKKLVSYLGLAPRVNESDGKGYNGRITKRTDSGLLKSLIQAAWVTIRYDGELFAFYANLKAKKGSQKAIVAVARKLVVRSYFVLNNAI